MSEDRIETYLGDGVWASFDGYQVWLRTQRAHGDDRIALEPPVYAALLEFVARLKPPEPEPWHSGNDP